MEIFIIIAIIFGVFVANMKKQQANEQRRKQEQAKAAFEQRAKQNIRVPEGQSAIWGTPDPDSEAFNGKRSDPFCQGPAGSYSSSEGMGNSEGRITAEGMGTFEGRLSTEGIVNSEGQMRSGEGAEASSSPRLKVVSTMVKTHDTLQVEQASPMIALSFDSKAVVQGILYAEILGKPKALRR